VTTWCQWSGPTWVAGRRQRIVTTAAAINDLHPVRDPDLFATGGRTEGRARGLVVTTSGKRSARQKTGIAGNALRQLMSRVLSENWRLLRSIVVVVAIAIRHTRQWGIPSSDYTIGIRIFPPGQSPRTYSPGHFFRPDNSNSPPFLHGVGHSPYQHHHAPIYIKRSTVIVYTVDSG